MKPDALIVIDVQAGLLEAHPYRENEFIQTLQKVLAMCRTHQVPVIYIQHEEAGSEIEHGTDGWQIAAAIAPHAGEKTVEKSYSSAFRGTGLHPYLQQNNMQRLIMCGMQTEYCVDTTVKVAFELGYKVQIPQGGTTTYDSRLFRGEDLTSFYERDIWQHRFAEVVPVYELLAEIAGQL